MNLPTVGVAGDAPDYRGIEQSLAATVIQFLGWLVIIMTVAILWVILLGIYLAVIILLTWELAMR